jgi:hypothetical protein
MHHSMSPTGVAVLLLLALVVDYLSVGPNSIRDRIAFFLGLAAIRQGFNGSPLDNWTVGFLSGAINQLKGMTGSAYIAGAVTSALIGAGVGVLAIYTVGALMPNKATKYLGRFAAIKFRSRGLKKEGHSPAPRETPAGGVKPQVSDTADTVLTPRGRTSGEADKDLAAFVDKHAERLQTNDLVRLAKAQFRASRSTILRRLREAKRRKEYGS